MTRTIPLLGFLALAAGCNINGSPGILNPGPSVAMQDSLEIELFSPATDDLHTPYVQGATFNVTIASTDYAQTTTAGWTLKSADPTVVSVTGTTGDGIFSVSTVGTGTTTLSVVDPTGKVLDSHAVQVENPDSVQLCAHGLLLGGLSDAQAQVTQATVIEAGTATFLVRYYLGSQELWGNHAVKATGTGAVGAITTTSSYGDDRDWVEVDAVQPSGSGQVSLVVGGSTMAVIPATVVPSSTVASVGVLAQSETNAVNGNTLYVFGRAFDAQGADIYGASFSWVANDQSVSGMLASNGAPSDVLSYTYQSSATETIADELSPYASSLVTVHGQGATVSSTADVGCSVGRAPGAGAGGAFALGLAAVGTLMARRRRAATARPRS